MRFIEKFMEFVSRTAIFELASEMKSAKDDVKNVRNILLEHLIKIIIFPKSTSLQHWKDEVFDYLRIINKIKLKQIPVASMHIRIYKPTRSRDISPE